MTKSEIEAVKARAAGQFDLTQMVQQEPSDITNLISDRERLIQALKPYAEALNNTLWPSSLWPIWLYNSCRDARALLREMGELE